MIDRLIPILVLKDRMQAWAGVASFFMVSYMYAAQILESNFFPEYIPKWLLIAVPAVFLVVISVIDMKYLLPLLQAYYTRSNVEWQEFREEMKK